MDERQFEATMGFIVAALKEQGYDPYAQLYGYIKENEPTGEYEVTLGAEAVEQNAEIYPVGDVNQDGKVNMTDIVLLIRYQAGWSVSIYEKAADMNADSKISMADLVLMIRKVMK